MVDLTEYRQLQDDRSGHVTTSVVAYIASGVAVAGAITLFYIGSGDDSPAEVSMAPSPTGAHIIVAF